MTSNRGYCFTCNNYTDSTLADILLMCDQPWLTYLVIGWEVAPDTGTPHLQGYMHFINSKTMSTIVKYIPRISLHAPKAEGESFDRRYMYCMEKKEGGNEDYWEYGDRPTSSISTSSIKVIKAIEEGLSYSEIAKLYPSYIMHHGKKVKAFIEERKPVCDTQFYKHVEKHDYITEINERFELDDTCVIVTELNQLELYSNYKTVIYQCPYYDPLHALWPRKVPIHYKYGYELKVVKCEKFIIVTSDTNYKLYPLYNKI